MTAPATQTPSGLTLAFYKAKGDRIDRAIRWWTASPYSHVELINWQGTANEEGHPEAIAFSASHRDGGVRGRVIAMTPGHWDYVPVPWVNEAWVWARAYDLIGAGYDYPGLILSQLLNLRRGSRQRWFCSELLAHLLDLPRPSAYSPGDLHDLVTRINALTNAPGFGQI